jgi:hypothetical protein
MHGGAGEMEDTTAAELVRRDEHARQIAVVLIQKVEPMHTTPRHDSTGQQVIGYLRRFETTELGRDEARYMLNKDVERDYDALRPQLHTLIHLNAERRAVILHMARAMTVDAVKKMDRFWGYLRASNYQQAANEMLRSAWPSIVGNAEVDRERALELFQIMLTGRLVASEQHGPN